MRKKLVALLLPVFVLGCQSGPEPEPDYKRRPASRKTVEPYEAPETQPTKGGPSVTNLEFTWPPSQHLKFGAPKHKPGSRDVTRISRIAYVLSHNNDDRIADWVMYKLTKKWVNGTERRPGSGAFKADPQLTAGKRAELTDYKDEALHAVPRVHRQDRGGDGPRLLQQAVESEPEKVREQESHETLGAVGRRWVRPAGAGGFGTLPGKCGSRSLRTRVRGQHAGIRRQM